MFIIQGGARGADAAAAEFAAQSGCYGEEFAAEWEKHGRAAGPIRNQRMLDDGRPDLVVAFRAGHPVDGHADNAEY